MSAYLRLTITDTLGVLVGGATRSTRLAKVTRTFWYRLPETWVSGRPAVAAPAGAASSTSSTATGWRTGQATAPVT